MKKNETISSNNLIDVQYIKKNIKKKCLPTIIGIGFPKTGSTWLYESLKLHPEIFMCENPNVKYKKELNYWSNYRSKRITTEQYFQLFDRENVKHKGEFSVSYCNINTLSLIYNTIPDVKIICGIRNPIYAIYSGYKHQLRNNPDKKHINFFNYYENHKKFLENDYYIDEIYSYCTNNFKIKFFFYFFKDLKKNPKILLKNVYKFLNIDSEFEPKTIHHKINKNYEFKSRFLHRITTYLARFINKEKNMQSIMSPTYYKNYWIYYLLKLNEKKINKKILILISKTS